MITCRSGFASLIPLPTGTPGPWWAWNPTVERKCGRLLEHPIPETITTFHGSSWSAWIAFWSALRSAKSPHPGHHVGLTADLYAWGSNAVFIGRPHGSW